MAGYANIVGRADLTDALVPDQVVSEILQTAAENSVMLRRAKTVRMSSKKTKQPVLASLPDAYWVDGDTGLKQTTKMEWGGLTMTAEELAVIVPISNAVIDDSSLPLWSSVKPLLAEAIGKKIDGATLFGLDKPASWPNSILEGATAAGNIVEVGDDFALSVSELAELIDTDGFAVNGFMCRPGLSWRLRGARDLNGRPIFDSALSGSNQMSLYGFSLDEVRNGSWVNESAELIAADWNKFIIGIRQDITYDLFSEGVISDADGKVILNLMQQDSKALRVVMRVGYQVANPMTRLNLDEATRYPGGVVVPFGSISGS